MSDKRVKFPKDCSLHLNFNPKHRWAFRMGLWAGGGRRSHQSTVPGSEQLLNTQAPASERQAQGRPPQPPATGTASPSHLARASSHPAQGLCESKGAQTTWQVEPAAAAVLSVAPGIPWGSASGIPQSSCCWRMS